MQTPKYKPGLWVRAKLPSSEIVGKLSGAVSNQGEWIYYISYPGKDKLVPIKEKDILEAL